MAEPNEDLADGGAVHLALFVDGPRPVGGQLEFVANGASVVLDRMTE